MKQIRIVGFICKAKDLPSRLREELEKAEKELRQYKQKSA